MDARKGRDDGRVHEGAAFCNQRDANLGQRLRQWHFSGREAAASALHELHLPVGAVRGVTDF